MFYFILGFMFATILYAVFLAIFSNMMRKKIQKRIDSLKLELDKNPDLFNEKLKNKVKKYIDQMDGLSKLEEKRESIKTRLIEAQEITKQQLELRAQAEMPSMNSAHSRYKNGLISEIQKLEEDKINILQSILDDGYDPVVSTINEYGESKQITLSEFLSKSSFSDEEPIEQSEETTTDELDENQPKKVGKFFLIKGGKDDGEPN